MSNKRTASKSFCRPEGGTKSREEIDKNPTINYSRPRLRRYPQPSNRTQKRSESHHRQTAISIDEKQTIDGPKTLSRSNESPRSSQVLGSKENIPLKLEEVFVGAAYRLEARRAPWNVYQRWAPHYNHREEIGKGAHGHAFMVLKVIPPRPGGPQEHICITVGVSLLLSFIQR
jgi:hypothetical protein